MLDWITPAFGPAETVLTSLVAMLLVYVIATASPRRLERLYARIEADPAAKVGWLRGVTALKLTLALLALELTLFSTGVDPADLGLRPVTVLEVVVAVAGAAFTVAVYAATAFWYSRRGPMKVDEAAYRHARVMRPRTPAERRWTVAAAVAEGAGAQVVHQGLLIAAGVGLLGLPVWAAALFAAVVWGLSNRAFGAAAVVSTVLLGLVSTAGYAAFGSLFVPVVLYVTVQLAGLFVLPGPPPSRAPVPPPLAFSPDSLTVTTP